jgi:hypothetical protein
MRIMRWHYEPHHDEEALEPPTRLATEGSPVRRVRFGLALLALAVLWTAQRASAAVQGCVGDCNNDALIT